MKTRILILVIIIASISQLTKAQPQKEAVQRMSPGGQHPVISDIISSIDQDSLAAIMQSMVDMGTRYMYAENRREVASMIAGKFRNWGYADVVLDSFKVRLLDIPGDSVWQYNVVATLEGTSAPGEIYIISGHHDDYSETSDPYVAAPGADDNASGCAVAMEIARVIKLKEFQPASTIRFVTYAAEEMTGYLMYSGSIYYAEKVKANHEDLRLDINNDMVAYTADTIYTIMGSDVRNKQSSWAGDLMVASSEIYSTLNVIKGSYPTSDATWFSDLGYPVTGYQEYPMTPTYHTIDDSVSNCIMGLCKDVAKANCAILLNEQLTPVPQNPYTVSGKKSIIVGWKPTANENVSGYRIYRSNNPDSSFTLIGEAETGDTAYSDTTAEPGTRYYYYAATFDNLDYESIRTNVVSGAVGSKERELLVVRDSKGGYNNPADTSVTAFYQQIFRDLPFDYSDATVEDSLNISILGKYKRIMWLSNAYSDQKNSSFRRNAEDICTYIRSGGQLFISSFQPSFLIKGNAGFNVTFNTDDTITRDYKIERVERTALAALNAAAPLVKDYDTIHIDPAKCLPQLNGHVMNVECLFPSADARAIYSFSSGYDSSTTQGSMIGKPVGLEYTGDDHKVIIISVPLYYMDSLEAKKLVELIYEKFTSHVGTDPILNPGQEGISIHVFPNPGHDRVTVNYQTAVSSYVIIELVSPSGQRVFIRNEGRRDKGSYSLQLPVSQLSPGVYILNLRTAKDHVSVKMMISD
jgi:Zn-dependent M28 family amino/carboxypeptidase